MPSPKVGLVELSSLANVDRIARPQPDRPLSTASGTVTILANPERMSLSEAVQSAKKMLKELNLPPQYRSRFLGQAKTLGETATTSSSRSVLSILFMYMILAAQFESWVHPMAILSALPVTIPFGLLSLVLFRQPMDLYAMFGLFMLVGIVKKNGILQVDKTNELRAHGHGARRGDPRSQSHPPAADPDDHDDAGRGDDPDRAGPGARRGARASMAKVIIGGQMLACCWHCW